jgi:pimeloyl-ACP methyl ester carboxylesterase
MLPVVLLPALLCDSELYATQLPTLTDLADPLVVTWAERDMARAAALVLERGPARFVLAGTSAGGNLALEVLAAAPARVAGLWLTGVNPGRHADPDGARLMQQRVRAGEFEAVLDVLAARCVHAAGARADEALGVLRAMARRAGPDVFLRQSEAVITRRDRWDVLTGLDVPTRRDRWDVLTGLDVPTLLLWGREDAFASVETARAIADRVRDARLVVVDDCGHLPTLERPEACVPAVRTWLIAVAERALGAPLR